MRGVRHSFLAVVLLLLCGMASASARVVTSPARTASPVAIPDILANAFQPVEESHLPPNPRNGLFVANNPINWMDPLGLLPADAIPIDGNAKYPWSPAAVPLVTDVINDSLLGQKGEHEEGITVFLKDDQYYYKRGITCPERTGSVQNFERDPDAIWDLHTHPNNSRGMNPFGPDAKYTQSTPYVVDSWNLFRMNPPGVHPIGHTFPKHPSHWWPDAKFGNK